MLLAALVVGVASAAQGFDDSILADAAHSFFVRLGRLDRGFERRERDARVAARSMRDAREQFVGNIWMQVCESTLLVFERATQKRRYVRLAQRFEREDAAAREQS